MKDFFRRLFFCVSVLASLLLLVPGSVKAQSINLGKSLIRVAHPAALVMPGMPGMPTSSIPNNYDSEVTMSFNANVGSQGTLYLSYNFTGEITINNPMCSQVKHTPKIGVQMFNKGAAKTYHYSAGYGSAPCVNMNQTLTLAFDLASDECQLSFLMDGTCNLEEQDDGILCPLAGDFAFLLKGVEIEGATTVDQVVGIYAPWLLTPYCAPSSTPPDWRGPIGADSFGSGYWVSTGLLDRTFIPGHSYGVPWKLVTKVGPSGEWAPGPPPICTMWDHGCSFVDQTCTAKANIPTDIHGEQVWRRNA